MKLKQILVTLSVLTLVTAGVFATTQPAAALECSILPSAICADANQGELEESGLWQILLLGINILTAGVGVVAVGAIAYAGFLYATAQDNAQQTKQALEMIRNTAIGLLLFAGMFAIVNFLVPGGVFSGTGTSPSTSESQSVQPRCEPGEPC